jgi:hypothetical protein
VLGNRRRRRWISHEGKSSVLRPAADYIDCILGCGQPSLGAAPEAAARLKLLRAGPGRVRALTSESVRLDHSDDSNARCNSKAGADDLALGRYDCEHELG